MQIFEIDEVLESGNGGQTVGLDGEEFEVGQSGEAADFGDLVLAEPELLEVGQGF
jgi:hypothetical protein